MRLASITINSLAAFGGEVKFGLPGVGLLEGRHGAGKSSLERIILYAFGLKPLAEKGQKSILHDPSIIHGNAEEGSAILTFEEGNLESLRVVVKGAPDNTTKRWIRVRGKNKWELAGDSIYDITNALAYDPMKFKDLNEKDRLEAFLRVAAVEISKEEFIRAVGGVIQTGIPIKIGLDTVNQIYDTIYSTRTQENSAADIQAKYAAQLEAALPPEIEGGDWNAEVKRLRSELAALESSELEEIGRIGKEFQQVKDAASSQRSTNETEIDRQINQQIAALEREREAAKSIQAQRESQAVEQGRAKANAEASEIKNANAPIRTRLTSEIATADERSRATAQAEGTREAAKTARAEAEARKAKSKAMTEALGRLTELKSTVASRMSIKGVTVASPREGLPVDICREENGALVPFSRWNEADSDVFALRMAVLHKGQCGIVCVDDISHWSPKRQENVIARCRELATQEGMQFLLGRATDDGELSIVDVTEATV